MSPPLALIVAVALNGVIGKSGRLPWRLPEDLRRFRALTINHTVIMGRSTWESLLSKPLPQRKNVVLSAQPGYQDRGALVASSLDAALAHCHPTEENFIAGGEIVFLQFLPLATKIYRTRVQARVDGDIHFPLLDESLWTVTESTPHPKDKDHPYDLTFEVLVRKE